MILGRDRRKVHPIPVKHNRLIWTLKMHPKAEEVLGVAHGKSLQWKIMTALQTSIAIRKLVFQHLKIKTKDLVIDIRTMGLMPLPIHRRQIHALVTPDVDLPEEIETQAKVIIETKPMVRTGVIPEMNTVV
jgi:hypothetical protein